MDELFKLRVLELIAQTAVRRARTRIKSQTLKEALAFEIQSSERAVVFVPHYWAIYHHDGRGVVPRRALPPGRYLVWYKDPSQDPRIAGGHPERASDIRRLSRAEFQRDLLAGKLVVTKRSGPAAGNPFFSEGLAGLDELVARRVTNEVRNEVRKLFPPRTRRVKLTLKF